MAFSVPIFVLVVNGIVTSFSGIYMEMCLGHKVFEKYHIHTLAFLSKITIELKTKFKDILSGQNILQFFHENSGMNPKF